MSDGLAGERSLFFNVLNDLSARLVSLMNLVDRIVKLEIYLFESSNNGNVHVLCGPNTVNQWRLPQIHNLRQLRTVIIMSWQPEVVVSITLLFILYDYHDAP